MNTRFYPVHLSFLKNLKTSVLFVVSVLGLISGVLLASYSSSSYYTLSAVTAKPTFVHLLFVNLVSPAFILLFQHYSLGAFCYSSVFADYLCRGFCGMTIYHLSGECAWLIRVLLMFSSYATSVVTWWLFFRHKWGRRQRFFKDSFVLLLLICLITVIDVFFVLPFLDELIIYF